MVDISAIKVREFRRMGRAAMRGHYWQLLLAVLPTVLVGQVCNVDWLPQSALEGLCLAAYVLLCPLWLFGREAVMVRRFRGEPCGPGLMFQFGRLPKLLPAWLLRDGIVLLLRMAVLTVMVVDVPTSTRNMVTMALLPIVIIQIWLGLNYGMAEYLWVDRPELGPLEALRESRSRMKGHRAQLLQLLLSMLVWLLLGEMVVGLPAIVMIAYSSWDRDAITYVAIYLIALPMLAYMGISRTAFFEVLNGRALPPSGADDETDAPDDPAEADENDVIGEVGGIADVKKPALRVGRYYIAEKPDIAMTADEVAAWDMLRQHHFSQNELARAGLLDDYLTLGVQPQTEARWRAHYPRKLMAAYPKRAEVMDEVMLLAAASGDSKLMADALQAMDDAATAYDLPDRTLLNQCVNGAMTVDTGAFDADPEVVPKLKAQLGELARRLETRLKEDEPDGDWKKIMKDLRARTM